MPYGLCFRVRPQTAMQPQMGTPAQNLGTCPLQLAVMMRLTWKTWVEDLHLGELLALVSLMRNIRNRPLSGIC